MMKALLLLCMLCFHPASGQSTKTYETDEFKISYPRQWELDESGKMGTKFVLYGPKKKSDGALREHIYLTSQALSVEGVSLEEYEDVAEQQLKKQISDYSSAYSKKTTFNDEKAIVTRYSGKQSESRLEWKQYYFIKDNIAYVLTYTVEKKDFEAKIERAQEIMDTFYFK